MQTSRLDLGGVQIFIVGARMYEYHCLLNSQELQTLLRGHLELTQHSSTQTKYANSNPPTLAPITIMVAFTSSSKLLGSAYDISI